jgi:hypothetical protein
MIRALLAGRKTQTRRLATSPLRRCEVGDRLWVRENWRTQARHDHRKPRDLFAETALYLPASGEWLFEAHRVHESLRDHPGAQIGKHRPGMHMPRWASRLTLIVEAVRVEPLQAISEADCLAEGPRVKGYAEFGRAMHGGPSSLDGIMVHTDQSHVYATPRCWYRELWSSLHTADGERWEDNPSVVAIMFRVERGNIDRIVA